MNNVKYIIIVEVEDEVEVYFHKYIIQTIRQMKCRINCFSDWSAVFEIQVIIRRPPFDPDMGKTDIG